MAIWSIVKLLMIYSWEEIVMKKIILGSVLLLSGLTLAGCGNHQAQSQSNAQSASAKSTATSQKAKQAQGPWNQTKDQQLAAFINQWAPTMGQQYQRYDGKHEMKIATGYRYPSQLKQTTVNDSQTSIGWAPTGKGKYAYNVVALYNDDQGGNRHITYAFAFHDGQPVALVDQGTSGTPNWTPTKNADVANHFAQIAAGQSSQSTTAPAKGKNRSNNQTSQKPQDPTTLGYRVFYTMSVLNGKSPDEIKQEFESHQIMDLEVDEVSGQEVLPSSKADAVYPANTYQVGASPSTMGGYAYQVIDNNTVRVFPIPSHFQANEWYTDSAWAKSHMDQIVSNAKAIELQTPDQATLNLVGMS